MSNFLSRIIQTSSAVEPYAGGKGRFGQKIKASLPFLRLITKDQEKVLVIGCGEGYEVKWLADKGLTAIGVTNSQAEALGGNRKYQARLLVADMHLLPYSDLTFDCVYSANILEHSVAPLIALQEWRRVLKPNGWLIVVMPSQEWLKEYYHFSVLTHSQTKELMKKAGFKLLAGPQMRPLIDLGVGDIFYDLGRGWGHYDGYVAEKTKLTQKRFMLGKTKPRAREQSIPWQLIRMAVKYPYNLVRVWHDRHHRE